MLLANQRNNRRSRRMSLLGCIGLALFLAPPAARAEVNRWTPTGPPGGVVQAIAIAPSAPSTIYAGTRTAGVFKSTDSGATWTSVSHGISLATVRVIPDPLADDGPATGILALAVDPTNSNIVYAGTRFGGMLKTIDGGQVWTPVNRGLDTPDVRAIAIDPLTPATVYAAGDYPAGNGGIFKSTDGASTWVLVAHSYPRPRALAIDPQTPTTVYAGGVNDSGVVKSTNGGASWTFVNCCGGVSDIAIDPQTPTTVYVGQSFGDISKTTDGGQSWVRVPVIIKPGFVSVEHVSAVSIDPVTPTTLYAATISGVFKSVDGGATWNRASNALPPGPMTAVAVDPSFPARIFAGGENAGFLKSTDGAANWAVANAGLFATVVNAVVKDPGAPAVLYAGTASGVFKTTDGGATWSARNTGLTNSDFFQRPLVANVNAIAIDPADPARVFAGTDNDLYVSTDGAASWTASGALRDRRVIAVIVAPAMPAAIYAGVDNNRTLTDSTLFRSIDGGSSFSPMPVTTGRITSLAFDPLVPNTVYATGACISHRGGPGCEGTGGVYRSIDAGTTWQTLLRQGALAIAIDPTTTSTLYVGLDGRGILKSLDGGTTWTPINRRLATRVVQTLAIDPAAPATIYAGTATGGVFRSVNGGACWAAVNADLTFRNVRALTFAGAPASVYAGTAGAGVFNASFPSSPPECGDRAEIAVYRPGTAEWFTLHADGTSTTAAWGAPAYGEVPVLGDYDGDGRTDFAVFRTSTGDWLISPSDSPGGLMTRQWGAPSLGDLPVQADYDGDGRTDLAVYRSSTGQWFVLLSGSPGAVLAAAFGLAGTDVPVPADYDGDGRADIAVFRPTTGEWFIVYSSNGQEVSVVWGAPSLGDVPVPRDFDGDGKADVAVYRKGGQWFIASSLMPGKTMALGWGGLGPEDVPVAGDYDADGIADLAVYRPSTGEWFIRRSSDGGTMGVAWGAPALGDVPLVRPASLR